MKKSNTKKAILKSLIGIAFISSTLCANPENIKFYNESSENYLLCKVGSYSYQMVSKGNSTLHVINGNKFYKLNSKNTYISNTGCQIIKSRD